MYLSRVVLNLRHPSVRQSLRDCNDMHRCLMQGFPDQQADGAARQRGGVLYRIEERRDELCLLLMSEVAPNREALAARGFMMSPDSPKDISGLRQVFREGLILRFELVASPCKKLSGDQKNSRRAFLRTEQERAEWLARKAAQGGFELLEAAEHSRSVPVDGKKGDMKIHYEAVRFSGVLRVLDPALFWAAYCGGIGPGKAYGLGMLTVARA